MASLGKISFAMTDRTGHQHRVTFEKVAACLEKMCDGMVNVTPADPGAGLPQSYLALCQDLLFCHGLTSSKDRVCRVCSSLSRLVA